MNETPLYGFYSELHTASTGAADELRRSFNTPEGWIAVGLLVLFLLNFRNIVRFCKTAYSSLKHLYVVKQRCEEKSEKALFIRLMLVIFSIVCLSFFLFLIMRYTGKLPDMPHIQVYFLILAAVVAGFLLKSFVLWLIGIFTETTHTAHMIAYCGKLYAIVAGIVSFLAAVLLFNLYTAWCSMLIITGLSLIFGVFLLYVVRLFQIFIASNISIFFGILYLCTIEIAPILVIYNIIFTI
ncbi:MAG: DUF4271 domain-containing protein [Prevotellaceae bacterium]|jgi:hypothetical protein|nr:DUF4271 domain-containing protein [Prevotellaceae bacterium]